MSKGVVLTARSANLSCKIKAGKLRHWPEASQTSDPKSFVLKAALAMAAVRVLESAEECSRCAQTGSTQNPETEPPGSWEPAEKASDKPRENGPDREIALSFPALNHVQT